MIEALNKMPKENQSSKGVDGMLCWVETELGIAPELQTVQKKELESTLRECLFCNKQEGIQEKSGKTFSLRPCAKCKSVFYCDRVCQKKHFKKHKKNCARLRGEKQ